MAQTVFDVLDNKLVEIQKQQEAFLSGGELRTTPTIWNRVG